MNNRLINMLQVAMAIIAWAGLAQLHDWIKTQAPIVASEQNRIQKLLAITTGPKWSERQSEAQAALKSWEGTVYRGASMAAVKANMMDHFTDLLRNATVTGYNVSLADKPFTEPLIDQPDIKQNRAQDSNLFVMTMSFSGNFNADSLSQFAKLLYEEGRILRLESVNVTPSKFEIVVKTMVTIETGVSG